MESGVAYVRGNTIVVESKFYFYGSALDKVNVKKIALNMQNVWNAARGTVTIDEKKYNVEFKIMAVPIKQNNGESDDDYTGRIVKKMQNEDGNIKKNWIRIEDVNPSDSKGTKTAQNSGFWLTSDVYTTDAPHEYWEGMTMNGKQHLEDCSGDGTRISCAENGNINGDTRKVTQDDIDDLKLGTLLKDGRKSAPVGFFGNKVYWKDGSDTHGPDIKEKNDKLKSQRGQ